MTIRSFLRYFILLALALPLAGCPVVTAPTPPLAPGYSSQTDQSLGEALAALNAFVAHERTVNYPNLIPAMQAAEKPYLNGLIAATNAASAAYTAFHAGTGTLDAAQTAMSNAQTAQSNLTTAMGVK